MQVTVKGRNVEVPQHVKDETARKLGKVERLSDHFRDMEVVFAEEHNPRIADSVSCEVTLHAVGGTLHAEASGPDLLSAVDAVQDKLVQQVRKLKGKVLDRTHRPGGNGNGKV